MHSNRCWIRGSSSSRSIGLSELHWFFVRYRACFLLEGEVWEDFPGLCKILHETTPLGWYGTTWDARRAYLSFPTLVGTGLVHVFWWMMEAIGRRWYLVGWI